MGTDRLRAALPWALAAATMLLACGDDDDDAAARCADGAAACPDQGRDGGAAGGGGAAGVDAGGRDRDGGAGRGGASGSSAPARDGGGGAASGDDAGGEDPTAGRDASTDPEPPTMPLPMTGDQLSLCSAPSHCDMGFGCYDEGPGRAFCTAVCEVDKDCKDIAGATYTCSDNGLCEVDCGGGPPGVEKCPDGLVCMLVSGPGPGGVRNRCKYSVSAGTSGEAFSPCSLPADCDEGLQCVGSFLTIPGYCTHACTETSECSAQPSSGAIEASCMVNACVLSCVDDPDGCPAGMACVETPLFSQCAYQ
jgi:hypothetical protein